MNSAKILEFSQNTANHPIDRLGTLKSQIAALTEEAKPLEIEIKGFGVGTHKGVLYDANVADVGPSESYDAAAMEEKLRDLGVDDRWFKRHTKTKAGYLRLTVKARGIASIKD